MKALIIIIITLTALFWNAIDVFASPALVTPTDKGARVNSHIEPKPGRSNECQPDPTAPALWYYLQPELDGQVTPIETAYADYLSDFAWHFEQNPGACRTAPEPLN